MKWFSDLKQKTNNALEVLPNENIPWWERKKEFDEAKKILIGLKVRFPGAIHNDPNEIGIIRKVYIQQPHIMPGGDKINAQIIAVVDFDKGCGGIDVKSLVPVDQPKIDSSFLLEI